MRRFSAEYLETTRAGMWEDSREALTSLDMPARQRVLDAGAGTGELTRVFRDEVPGETVALDADRTLLHSIAGPTIVGDATKLPCRSNSFDLVGCQALLINLPDPSLALEEFARVSSDLVAAIEPDNSAVTVDSTVEEEEQLNERARSLYLDGVETDVTLGGVEAMFREADLDAVTVERYDHVQTVEPPYTAEELESAQRKASGAGLRSNRDTILAGEMTPDEFDHLRDDWRAMGRKVAAQMQADEYRRRETVPFFVTVGHV